MWGLRLLVLMMCLAGLAACSSLDTEPGNRGSILEGGVFGDLRARQPKGTKDDRRGLIPVGGGSGRSEIVAGADGAAAEGSAGGTGGAGASEPGSYRMNFENAEMRDVVQAVLGEALGLNYTLSPDVAGTVTLSSSAPVSRDELLSTLEVVLQAQGFAMTKSGGVYKIAPIVPGGGTVDVGRTTSPGYGVSVIPLRYVSVRAMRQLLGGFIVDAEGLRLDSTRNALVVSGPGPKRDEVVRTVLSFDADWMADQSVGLFELRRSKPDAVATELAKIFDSGEAGGGGGVIQFQAIRRLNAVMAISKNQALLRRAESWARRLDRESETSSNVFVYRARYRDAKELARIVSGLFGASADLGSGESESESGQEETPSLFSESGSSSQMGAGGDNGSETGGGQGGGEAPIDDITGASETGGGGGNAEGGGTAVSSSASPDVIDLTRQGTASGGTSGIRVSADIANNSVITYADPETYRKVLATLRQLDSEPLQVAIQATIAEVRLTNDLKYGVQYFVKSGSLGLGSDNGSVSFQQAAGALARQIPGFNFLIGSASDPDVIVSALDKLTDVEVLSSPSLVVMENQTASLQVGDDVPIAISQRQSTEANADIINEIEYRNTGIILKVTPRIGDNGAVTMKIDQEISQVNGAAGSLNPTFSKRKVSSQISVVSGQTVVLAGLITTGKENVRSGLPLFNRIPGLRDVTGDSDKAGNRTELVVLIKPVVIEDSADAQSVAEDMRSRMWAIGQRERKAP